MSGTPVITVSALNKYVKAVLDEDKNLGCVYVKGEISNFKKQAISGHCYFTLKDSESQIRAAMFRGVAARLKFVPEDTMNVIVRGHVSLYVQGGEYQVIVDDMQPDGTGALALAFEQLKKKLSEKGMFDPEHKKPIPVYPSKVGVVTSESGAAIRDIINVVGRRYPCAEVVLYPVTVQGDTAAPMIAEAVRYFNKAKAADVLIVGRGGGSIEDLWAFNEEIVAQAVYDSTIPVISAVGHETDFTICDFVADLRAPTPSAGAELAVPDSSKIFERIVSSVSYMQKCIYGAVGTDKMNLDRLIAVIEKNSPSNYVDALKSHLSNTNDRMNSAVKYCMAMKKNAFESAALKIDSHSPMKVLSMGYSVVSKDGKTISDSSLISTGDVLDVRMSKGNIKCEVIE